MKTTFMKTIIQEQNAYQSVEWKAELYQKINRRRLARYMRRFKRKGKDPTVMYWFSFLLLIFPQSIDTPQLSVPRRRISWSSEGLPVNLWSRKDRPLKYYLGALSFPQLNQRPKREKSYRWSFSKFFTSMENSVRLWIS